MRLNNVIAAAGISLAAVGAAGTLAFEALNNSCKPVDRNYVNPGIPTTIECVLAKYDQGQQTAIRTAAYNAMHGIKDDGATLAFAIGELGCFLAIGIGFGLAGSAIRQKYLPSNAYELLASERRQQSTSPHQ